MGVTFPQHGDEPDAAYFAALAGQTPGPGFIVSGLGFSNVDYAGLTFDVDAGKAFVVRSSMTTASSDVDPAESVSDVVAVVEFDGATGVDLTDGQVNDVYLNADVGVDDNASIVIDPSAVEDDMLKIGEVDTSNDTTSPQWYLAAGGGSLTFPNEAAIDAADAAGLRAGTIVYDRSQNTQYVITE